MASKESIRSNIAPTYEELASAEMVLTAFSMLEARGYHGFNELSAVINDPEILLRIVRLMYGMEIKVPPLDEFVKTLRAAQYVFMDMHKKISPTLEAKPRDIREFMGIDQDEEKELLTIFDDWAAYMAKHGHDICSYFHMNRKNTKKRAQMAAQGKRWTKKIY